MLYTLIIIVYLFRMRTGFHVTLTIECCLGVIKSLVNNNRIDGCYFVNVFR